MNTGFIETEINIRFPEWKIKALTFSYDDGVLEDERLVDLFNQYCVKGTFNINSGRIGAGKIKKAHARLDADAVSSIYTSGGHEVAMHSLTHPFLNKMDSLAISYEVMQDRINLEKLTGGIVRGFAYPYGIYNDDIVNVLESLGVLYARTTIPTGTFFLPDDFMRLNPTCHHYDKKLMEYAEKFVSTSEDELERRDPMLFYVWGHSYEFEDSGKWHVIENFLKTVSHNDSVWYATNLEICEYIKCFRQLVFNVERTRVYNPTNQKIYFEHRKRKYSVESGQTVELSF